MSQDPPGTRAPAGPKRASKRGARRRRKRRSGPRSVDAERPLEGADPYLEVVRALRRLVTGGERSTGAPGDPATIDLRVSVPVAERAAEHLAARQLEARVEAARRDLRVKEQAFTPGRVYCLRCGEAACAHSFPPTSRTVFAGYTPTGLPRWTDWAELLLERRDPDVQRVHARPPGLVVREVAADDLTERVLDIYARDEAGVRLWGQVDAGWFLVPKRLGGGRLAVSLQVISVRGEEREWRFGLNVLGTLDGGQSLEALLEHWHVLPWAETAAWGRGVLRNVESAANAGREESESVTGEVWQRRARGLSSALARRLEKTGRTALRRTEHAKQRSREARPVGKALADLAEARRDQVLYDVERQTFVVLGERGRAHVFSPEGRLVTSIRYTPASIERRVARGHWRRAKGREITSLREACRTLRGARSAASS